MSDLARHARLIEYRHGCAVHGFDIATVGIDEKTIGEFLTAVDDVVTRFPEISVQSIDLAGSGTEAVIRVTPATDDSDPTGPLRWSVVLGEELTREPGRLAEVIRKAHRPESVVARAVDRLVYAATIAEFGRAVETCTAGRVRSHAERTLIAEYLRGTAYRSRNLAQVVAGYKRWRDQLSGAGFRQGRLDPSMALIESFTDVAVNGSAATEPARVLCRLLIEGAAREGVLWSRHRI
ncbi:hypothetical protein [Nocardia fusca]|uniref:hypothetical protein n=1 Tax=Nocardia fusca TaxID=941183 RepID=UPI0007A73813|nr:hypothetical protein [Nocardia fusca]